MSWRAPSRSSSWPPSPSWPEPPVQRVPDPYRVLGVGREATPAEVKAAHRRLAKRYHPDAPNADATASWRPRMPTSCCVIRSAAVTGIASTRTAPSVPNRPRRPDDVAVRTTPRRSTRRPRPDHRRPVVGPPTAGPTRRSGRTTDRHTPTAGHGPPRACRGGRTAGRPRAGGRPGDEALALQLSRLLLPTAAVRPPPPPPMRRAAAAAAGPRTPSTGDAELSAGSRNEFDVFSRSSGAAWSSASRAYFRRRSAEMPSGAANPNTPRWTTPVGAPMPRRYGPSPEETEHQTGAKETDGAGRGLGSTLSAIFRRGGR